MSKFDELNFNTMNKLSFILLFLFAGIVSTSAQTAAQNQPGNGNGTTRVIVTVFPNPVIDIVTVAFDSPVKDQIVETFNVNGQRMPNPSDGHGNGNNTTQVDLSGFAAGIYILKVFSGGELLHVQKLLKN